MQFFSLPALLAVAPCLAPAAWAGFAGGTVVAWARNDTGQTNVPPDLTNAVAVVGGAQSSVALRADGTVCVWGVGAAWWPLTNVPPEASNTVAVSFGFEDVLALQADGHIVAWGYEMFGPVQVPPGLSNVCAVAACFDHALALKSDGTVVAWGAGLTNTGTGSDFGQSLVPPWLSNVVAIAARDYTSVALRGDGTLVAWGWSLAKATPTCPPACRTRWTSPPPTTPRWSSATTAPCSLGAANGGRRPMRRRT